MKRIAWLLALTFLTIGGCATTTTNIYTNTYNDALLAGRNIAIIKSGDFKTIHTNVSRHLRSLGYEKLVFQNSEQGFFVVHKSMNLAMALLAGSDQTDIIILKYTKAGEGKTRIDLVNGTTIIVSKKIVDRDIQTLADLIRGD